MRLVSGFGDGHQMKNSVAGCEKKLQVIEGASHLFEEPGTIDQVCEAAGQWLVQYLQTDRAKNDSYKPWA